MRIVDISEIAVPLKTNMRNAAFDFSEMTTSVVAVVTDVLRAGKPVVGYAFNSTGRYACGAQMRARFIPRILKSDPATLVNDSGTNFDPAKILACMMQREKPGGHTERSVAIGTIEVACWDAVAKIEDKPLYRVLAERYTEGGTQDKVQCYVGGGWYHPDKGVEHLQDEIRRRLAEGYTTMKIKVGGATIPEDVERIEAALAVLGDGSQLAVDANGAFRRDRALAYGVVQFAHTLDALQGYGWKRTSVFPHGGNQMTLHIVGGFGLGGCEAYPDVFGAFAGFADDARVDNGWLKLPDRPGIGFEAQNELYALMRQLA